MVKSSRNEIWESNDADEAAAADALFDEDLVDDGRIEPEYEVMYRQTVEAQDVYSSYTTIDPSSARYGDGDGVEMKMEMVISQECMWTQLSRVSDCRKASECQIR